MKINFKNKKGFITLTSVLIIMAVMIFVVRGISLQVIDEGHVGLSNSQYLKAKNLANGCAEYVLMELSNDPAYSTTGEITADLGGDSCEVLDIAYSAPTTTIQINSEVGDGGYTYLLEVVVSTTTATTTPSVVVDSWQEVDSF
jgi:hypothetical protein